VLSIFGYLDCPNEITERGRWPPIFTSIVHACTQWRGGSRALHSMGRNKWLESHHGLTADERNHDYGEMELGDEIVTRWRFENVGFKSGESGNT
jgi:hypothetical protein